MSEFTSGYLILKRDEEKVRQFPPPEMVLEERWQQLNDSLRPGLSKEDYPPFILKSLNDKWSVLLIEETGATRESKRQLRSWTLEASKQFPLLYFYNAEDHGWGYKLFIDGAEVSSVDVNYENMMTDEMGDEHEDASEFQEISPDQYNNKNVGAFAVFDVQPDTVDTLDTILTSTWYLDNESIWNQVEEFKEELGITEMSWTSYDYEITDSYYGRAS